MEEGKAATFLDLGDDDPLGKHSRPHCCDAKSQRNLLSHYPEAENAKSFLAGAAWLTSFKKQYQMKNVKLAEGEIL